MDVAEELERLKEDIKRHFDNEMELVRRVEELNPSLSEEQTVDLLRSVLEHPHADTARAMFSDAGAVEAFMKLLHGGSPEASEEESPKQVIKLNREDEKT